MKEVGEKKLRDIDKELNRALISIFGKDLPEGTNLYSKDK